MSSGALNARPCRFSEIYLHTESESFDLHDSFDFVGFTYDVAQRIVTLRWIPNQCVSSDQRRSLIVEMRGVSHVSSSPRDSELPFSGRSPYLIFVSLGADSFQSACEFVGRFEERFLAILQKLQRFLVTLALEIMLQAGIDLLRKCLL